MKKQGERARFWVSIGLLLAMVSPAIAGQDIFALDFDPNAELARLGLDTSPASLEALATEPGVDTPTRYLALVAIGRSGSTDALEFLARFCSDNEHPDLQLGAIQGLSELGDPKAIPIFQTVLQRSKREASTQSALLALARFNLPESRQVIISSARSGGIDRAAMVSTVHLFRRAPGSDSDALLRELQGHSDLSIRATAAIGLSERFGEEYDGILVEIAGQSIDDLEVWPDVVRQLERSSGEDFATGDEIRAPYLDRPTRLDVNQRIADWHRDSSQIRRHEESGE